MIFNWLWRPFCFWNEAKILHRQDFKAINIPCKFGKDIFINEWDIKVYVKIWWTDARTHRRKAFYNLPITAFGHRQEIIILWLVVWRAKEYSIYSIYTWSSSKKSTNDKQTSNFPTWGQARIPTVILEVEGECVTNAPPLPPCFTPKG